MQAKPRIARILVIALIVSLLLGACGGGDTGRTWFNLPAIAVRVQPDGTAKIWGFNLGAVILQPAQLQQFQAGGMQQLLVRIGYNGIHLYVNGQDLPYLNWDQTSTANLQEVIRVLPGVPNAAMIADLLPWLRTFGLGVMLDLPVPQGATVVNVPWWSGETSVTPETPAETTIGPATLAGVAFDDQGNMSVQGIPVSTLGLNIQLPPNVLAIVQALGIDSLTIKTQPNGIDLMLDDKTIPGIAYDTARLNALLAVAPTFVGDPATVATLEQVVPLLPGADVTVAVSFTGEPIGETDLGKLQVTVTPEGDIQAMGMTVAESAVDAQMLESLQQANVQQLDVSMDADGLFLAANGQLLPSITWTDESLTTLAGIVAPLAGVSQELVDTGLGLVRSTGVDVSVQLPAAEGAEAVEIPAEIDRTLQAPDLGEMSPATIRLDLTYDQGTLTSIGNLAAADLAALGLALPLDLPPATVQTLYGLGADQVTISTGENALNVALDGETALTVAYDADSLNAALDLAAPFLGGTPLENPTVLKLLQEVIVPLIPAADVEINVNLE